MPARVRTRIAVVLLLVVAILTTSCGLTVPTDPEGTLDRVRGGVLRVGVAVGPPWTELPRGADTDAPTGVEAELVERFAEDLDAHVAWVTGGEAEVIRELEEGRLDLVIAGLTDTTPWVQHVAITRPYATVRDDHGKPERHVMAVHRGENAFLDTLERFLLRQDVPR